MRRCCAPRSIGVRRAAAALALASGLIGAAHAQNFNYGDAPSWQPAFTNAAVTIKATPGTVRRVVCDNPNSSTTEWVQFYDTTASVVVGTTAPKFALPVQAGVQAINVDVNFTAAIKAAATTSATGGGAPSTDLQCTLTFR